MTMTTAEAPRVAASPLRRAMAGVAQFASYMTTLWAVQWVWSDGQLVHQVVAALVVEALLVSMKGALWNTAAGDDVLGWVGLVVDTLTNMGGILPRAGLVLTWPPIATVLKWFGVPAADPIVQAAGGFLLALIGGIILSILPHRLWSGKIRRR